MLRAILLFLPLLFGSVSAEEWNREQHVIEELQGEEFGGTSWHYVLCGEPCPRVFIDMFPHRPPMIEGTSPLESVCMFLRYPFAFTGSDTESCEELKIAQLQDITRSDRRAAMLKKAEEAIDAAIERKSEEIDEMFYDSLSRLIEQIGQ